MLLLQPFMDEAPISLGLEVAVTVVGGNQVFARNGIGLIETVALCEATKKVLLYAARRHEKSAQLSPTPLYSAMFHGWMLLVPTIVAQEIFSRTTIVGTANCSYCGAGDPVGVTLDVSGISVMR